jgi:hypothetical protein
MPRWLSSILTRIHAYAEDGKIRLTAKAIDELSSLATGLDPDDVRDVLRCLTAGDSVGRMRSAVTGEWMYIWKPDVFQTVLYVKLIVRGDCVIVSFHEDQGGRDEGAP